KMVAERAGAGPALLTSADGVVWAYYGEIPPMKRAMSLLRDPTCYMERRWKLYGEDMGGAALGLWYSPDLEHWFPAPPPLPGMAAADGVFWVEEGRVLGLLEGGCRLVAGSSERLTSIAEVPAAVLGEEVRVIAAPLTWAGRRRLFLAAPDGWRCVDAPVGRWIGLTAAEKGRPGVVTTVPVALNPTSNMRLWVDVEAQKGGVVEVEVLNAEGAPEPSLSGRIRRGEGWLPVAWRQGSRLNRVKGDWIQLRFRVGGDARLYGFRFEE
ncbi:MAG: hypothetical protein QHJ73_13375, partial [Armatimonadota bacterium]|nr:hypothetical protein [Armatimonadota bacterium]